jgi:hypothetical protein
LLALSLASFAFAGEIQILDAEESVTIEVDGRAVAPGAGDRSATAADLAGGTHRVQIYDLRGTLVVSTTVTAKVDEQVRLELHRGQLIELGRGPLAPRAAECPAPAPAGPGGLQVTGLYPEAVAVWVDAQPVRWQPTRQSFLVEGLASGAHDVRIAKGNQTWWTGPMRVYPGLVRRCVPDPGPQGVVIDCVFTEGAVALPPAAPPPPPPATVKAAPLPMAEGPFTAFLAAVAAESFSETRLGLVESVAANDHLTIAQVARVMDQMGFDADKVEAARILAPRTLDPENAWQLASHLTFAGDKDTVQKLFR